MLVPKFKLKLMFRAVQLEHPQIFSSSNECVHLIENMEHEIKGVRNNALTEMLSESGGIKVKQIKRLWTLQHFHTHKV